MQGDDLFQEYRFCARDVLDGLAGHGVRQEADEIAGMPGLERHPDFAVGLEPADAGAVPGARVDDHERPPRRIDLDPRRRNHPHEGVIDRPFERAAVDDELDLVVEHMRGGLGQVFTILIAALAHDVPEQHAALRGIEHVFHGGSKQAERRWGRTDRRRVVAAGWHVSGSYVCLVAAACRAVEGGGVIRLCASSAAA